MSRSCRGFTSVKRCGFSYKSHIAVDIWAGYFIITLPSSLGSGLSEEPTGGSSAATREEV